VTPQSKIHHRKFNILWLAFTGVILVAFFFRFYRLADHPLGLFFDPAINGLDAVRLIQRGSPVIFFPTNGGREALFMYLLMPFIWLFDTTPFSLRALAATISLLNVALLFGFLYDTPKYLSIPKFHDPKQRIWLATFGSLILAVSYWHIAVSRPGLRSILVPMLSVPIFWFFLKGWATGHKRWFLLSGLLLGLTGHTYGAARLLPVILILALLPEFFLLPAKGKSWTKSQFTNLTVFVFAALIVYLPMAWYLINHPAQFGARAFSVMVWNFLDTPADIIAELGRNAVRVAGFFCCAGSPNPIFGLPGYPGSPLLLLPFLLIGLGWALKNWRNLFMRLVALWWFFGSLPSVIAIEAPHPLRMIVAVVPTAILIALGLIFTIIWLQKRFARHALRLTPVLALILILLPVPGLIRAYFNDWTDLQTTRGVYDYGAIAIRNEIFRLTKDDIPIYLPLSRFNDSPLLYYLSGTFERQATFSTEPSEQAVVISPEINEADPTWVRLHEHTATVLPPLTAQGQELIQTALASAAASSIRTVDGETVARLAPLPADPARFVQQPTHPISATFGPASLLGAHYDPVINTSQERLPVTLYWQANQTMADEYEVLVRLVDDQRRTWGSGDARPTDWVYPTSFWRPGLDEIAAQHSVTLESLDPLPPGRYWLAVSVFDPAKNRRLPLPAGTSSSPDTFFVGPLKVPLPPPPSVPLLEMDEITFGNLARLEGFSLNRPTVKAGEPIEFDLLWEAIDTPAVDYTVFTHLLDASDKLVAGHDTQPVSGSYPTSIWSSKERILDQHLLPTPDTLPPGQYRLAIGFYHQPSGQRLPVRFNNTAKNQGRFILPQKIVVAGQK
jgi:hypothetical protein